MKELFSLTLTKLKKILSLYTKFNQLFIISKDESALYLYIF
jgi:hypothetical protein